MTALAGRHRPSPFETLILVHSLGDVTERLGVSRWPRRGAGTSLLGGGQQEARLQEGPRQVPPTAGPQVGEGVCRGEVTGRERHQGGRGEVLLVVRQEVRGSGRGVEPLTRPAWGGVWLTGGTQQRGRRHL